MAWLDDERCPSARFMLAWLRIAIAAWPVSTALTGTNEIAMLASGGLAAGKAAPRPPDTASHSPQENPEADEWVWWHALEAMRLQRVGRWKMCGPRLIVC